jgi:alkanesulfonate monooxygenase SsuD/methylene tetrahydromethanopterin reductase-like flavin-dependent oxidoreductase (luciferase family)
MMADYDISPRRPLQLGVATATDVDWLTPAHAVRVRGGDLREVGRRASAARREHPHTDVVVDIEYVIANSERKARELVPADASKDSETILYVGTPAGLAGLIADIHAINIADGAVLIPRVAENAALIRDAVLPVLRTMGRLPLAAAQERTA